MDFYNPDLPFGFDIERIIDDVVLFCMLIGNDFLPHSPTLDISEGAMTSMFDTYKRILPTMGGYMTNAGKLDHARLELFVSELAKEELSTLQDRAKVCNPLLKCSVLSPTDVDGTVRMAYSRWPA